MEYNVKRESSMSILPPTNTTHLFEVFFSFFIVVVVDFVVVDGLISLSLFFFFILHRKGYMSKASFHHFFHLLSQEADGSPSLSFVPP